MCSRRYSNANPSRRWSLDYRAARGLARVHAVAETGAGLLLVLGLLTPLAVAAIIGVMLNAVVAVHWGNGPWASDGGWEFPVVLGVTAGGLALTGPGAWALDAVLGLMPSATWGVAGIVVGLVVGLAVLTLGREHASRADDASGRAATA